MSRYKEDEEKYTRMPVFNGERDKYRLFMTVFEAWEDKEKTRESTSVD